MIRLATFIVQCLPFAPDERRVLDEVLADWRHERNALRGSLALAGATVGLIAQQVRTLPRSPALWSIGAWLVGMFTLFQLIEIGMRQGLWSRTFAQGAAAELAAVFSVGGATFVLPLAAFLGIACLRNRVQGTIPVLGLAGLTMALSFGLTSFAGPIANQAFRVAMYEAAGRAVPPVRGAPEQTTPELLVSNATGAKEMLARRAGLTFVVPCLLLLAAQVRRLPVRFPFVAAAGLVGYFLAMNSTYGLLMLAASAVVLACGLERARAHVPSRDSVRAG